MAEIIDVLMQYDDAAYEFTVNTAASYVNLTQVNDGILSKVGTVSGIENEFQERDNFVLLSIGVQLPLSFEFWPNDNNGFFGPFIDLYYKRISAAPGVLNSFRPASVHVPFSNYEMSLGNFTIVPALGENFHLCFQLPRAVGGWIQRISMLNVPAELNELTFKAPVFAKIMHTLPMV
jgi:hypothetical protein